LAAPLFFYYFFLWANGNRMKTDEGNFLFFLIE